MTGTVLIQRDGKEIFLVVSRLRARYIFSTEDDSRQAEMLAQQIELAYEEGKEKV